MSAQADKAFDRLKRAAIVVAEVLDADERDPSWAESQELEAAAIEYGRAAKYEMVARARKRRIV